MTILMLEEVLGLRADIKAVVALSNESVFRMLEKEGFELPEGEETKRMIVQGQLLMGMVQSNSASYGDAKFIVVSMEKVNVLLLPHDNSVIAVVFERMYDIEGLARLIRNLVK